MSSKTENTETQSEELTGNEIDQAVGGGLAEIEFVEVAGGDDPKKNKSSSDTSGQTTHRQWKP